MTTITFFGCLSCHSARHELQPRINVHTRAAVHLLQCPCVYWCLIGADEVAEEALDTADATRYMSYLRAGEAAKAGRFRKKVKKHECLAQTAVSGAGAVLACGCPLNSVHGHAACQRRWRCCDAMRSQRLRRAHIRDGPASTDDRVVIAGLAA